LIGLCHNRGLRRSALPVGVVSFISLTLIEPGPANQRREHMPSLESWLAAMPSLQTFGPVGSHLQSFAGAVIRSLGDPTCGVHPCLRAPRLCLVVAFRATGAWLAR
jgi:hypothetical protein